MPSNPRNSGYNSSPLATKHPIHLTVPQTFAPAVNQFCLEPFHPSVRIFRQASGKWRPPPQQGVHGGCPRDTVAPGLRGVGGPAPGDRLQPDPALAFAD